ncbi:DUF982 domain-containing protein [Pseudorhizobium sp. NPDC055634]
MNMMITTSDIRWPSPVRVRVGYGFPETIRGPREALAYLDFRWPAIYGECYRQAKEACTIALADGRHAETARRAFLDACVEAQMLDEAAA